MAVVDVGDSRQLAVFCIHQKNSHNDVVMMKAPTINTVLYSSDQSLTLYSGLSNKCLKGPVMEGTLLEQDQ